VNTIKARVAFVLISKLYRQMYANTGIAPTAPASSGRRGGRTCWAAAAAGCSSRRRCPNWRCRIPDVRPPGLGAGLQIMPLIMMEQRRQSGSSLTGRPN
jgi:hypothetical protein